MKKIIVYLGDEVEKRPALEQVLRDMKLPYKLLEDKDLVETVGYLMDLEGFQPTNRKDAVHFSSDLMLFQDILDEEITDMNKRLATVGIEMKRKAMLTEHNKNWLLCDLMKEIEQEHQYFQYREAIHKLLTQSSELIIEAYTPESWKRYEEVFYQGYAYLQKETSLEDIERVYTAFVKAKEGLVKR